MTSTPRSIPLPFGRSAVILLGLLLATATSMAVTLPAGAETGGADAQHLERTLDRALAAAPDADRRRKLEAIRGFYGKRGFRAFWFDGAAPNRAAAAFLEALRRAGEHGLEPAAYGIPGIEALPGDGPDRRAEKELELTRTLLAYAGDLARGSVNPSRTAPGLFIAPERPDPAELLTGADLAPDFRAWLVGLAPTARRYVQMQRALVRYRKLAEDGGWPTVPEGPTLREGDTDARITALRKRLIVTGDLLEGLPPEDPESFDILLDAAVKRFQGRHGLEVDGAVGPATLRELNVSAERRVRQLVINLERRRWETDRLGAFYVFVNIADFEVKVVDRDETIWTSRIIVGRDYRKTPIFSDRIRQIEFNPYWNVPRSIAVQDLLPRIRKDPGYLARNRYLLLTRAGDNSSAIDPHSVDWSSVTARNFPYALRQRPGKGNALGTMIFRFPNRHNVYLHDTSSPELFQRAVRTFSSGCIRVQDAPRLAEILLRSTEGWDRKRIEEAVARDTPGAVRLAEPVPIHISYITAWANRDGTVHFRPDIYERDPALDRALAAAPRR